ncbi:MAG: porin family protein [Bacteroidales bacterium]|jgi:hypothetical protein|nr:porin family protein [Bacteroidales bacterium]MDD4528528.1 porin family protein [Bacteroidales bacterium]
MKKIILTTVLALGIAFSSNAQNLGYGILLGGNVSGITESPDQLYLGSKFGFQIGGFADYYFSDNVYLKANLMFITKGARNEATALGVSIYTNINPMYIQVPLIIGYSFNVNEDLNLNINLGGYAALGVAGKSTSEIKGDSIANRNEVINYFKETTQQELLYLGNNKRLDYGLRFGLGIDVNKLLFLSFDFDLGLANVYNDKNVTDYYSKSNYTLGLTLGYRF